MKLNKIRLFPLALLALASCGDESFFSGGGEGSIDVKASVDSSVTASITTRSTDDALSVDINDFTLSIVKTDGKYSKVCKFSDYSADEKIGVGTYDIRLEYGSISDEGFACPYYYGETRTEVLDQQTSSPELVARLANSMVKVNFTEAFNLYYSDCNVTVHSVAGKALSISSNETRPLYVRPGNVAISLQMTSVTGKFVNINAATISAEPCKLYNVTVDANGGEVGKASIKITFDDATVEEPIIININDDIQNEDPPLINLVGFTPDTPIEIIEGEGSEADARFDIIANAGLKSVVLTTTASDLLAKGWPASIDLVSADFATKQKLVEMGLKTKGLESVIDRMAVINLADVVRNLRAKDGAETATFSVKVTDNYGRVYPDVESGETDPVLSVNVHPIEFAITSEFSIPVGVTESTLQLTTNGRYDQLKDNLKFTAHGEFGREVECEIKSITPVTRAGESSTYDVVLALPVSNINQAIACTYRNSEIVQPNNINLSYTEPEGVEISQVTVMQNRAVLKLSSGEHIADILGLRTLYMNNEKLTYGTDYETNGDQILVNKNMAPASTYEFDICFLDAPDLSAPAATLTVTTPAEVAVPNGDFESLNAASLVRNMMDEGGQYTITVFNVDPHQNNTSFNISEPKGWFTTNSVTASSDAATQNSWFVVPSVYNTTLEWFSHYNKNRDDKTTPDIYKNLSAQNGANAMVIRNVAYDHNGKKPDRDVSTHGVGSYYCRKQPASIASRAAGKLKLGADGNGASFAGTPVSLKGYYKYALDSQDPNEKATVKVVLYSGASIVASGSIELGDETNYKEFTITLNYTNQWVMPDKLQIEISSSNRPDSQIRTTNYCSLHEQTSRGAQLTIDNLTFAY